MHLASGTDEDSGNTLHRFLVDRKKVKYILAPAGVFSMGGCSAAPVSTILPQLPKFPTGDWNWAVVTKNKIAGRIFFQSYSESSLPGIKDLWHSTCIDQLHLTDIKRLEHNVYVVSHPSIVRQIAVAVFNHFPSEIHTMQNEAAIYKAIEGHEIGYKFLGHLMEEGRAIGYLMEYIEGHRLPGPQDLGACLRIVKRLHNLGYKHGRISKEIFHIHDDLVWLAQLWSVTKCTDSKELKEELDIVAFVVAGVVPRFSRMLDNRGD